MSNEDSLKKQRDRFLSFSFSTSDLLFQINGDGKIIFALGAVKVLTGYENAAEIKGLNWVDLFSRGDRLSLKVLVKSAVKGLRNGPVLVSFDKSKSKQNILVSTISMPSSDDVYISVAVSNALTSQIGDSVRGYHDSQPLDKDTFIAVAQETIGMAGELGENLDMTFIDLYGAEKAKKAIGSDEWNKLSSDIDKMLCNESIDGGCAVQIDVGKFSVLHDDELDIGRISKNIANISKERNLSSDDLTIRTKKISADNKDMDERDAMRALFFTLSEFERNGSDMTIETLNTSFKSYVAANTGKIKEFKEILEKMSFSMHFQPIVDLNTSQCTHYEMLCRFQEGNTFEWVLFGEEVGLAAEFDISVCRRSFHYISNKRYSTDEKFSINVSGQSIQNDAFFAKLMKEIDGNKSIKGRVIIEITESSRVSDLEKVAGFITKIQDAGLEVALDDFGAGSASFQYLNSLPVDYVKIDGQYIKNIMHDRRDLVMVKNLTQMCKDLGVKVIGEFVEDGDIASTLRGLGVDYGQGYYFGKPNSSPDYKMIG